MEESREQRIVVFALMVTEPASECVRVCGGGVVVANSLPPTNRFRNN